MAHLVSGSWPQEQCQVWAPSTGLALSPIKVIGYSHNFYATIVLVGILFRQVSIVAGMDSRWARLMLTFVLW